MSISESIVIGVISGVLASASLFALSKIFRKIVLPWYRELVYRGVDISGTWQSKAKLDDITTETVSLDLNQKAHYVSGSYIIVKTKNGKDAVETMELIGEIKDRFFSGIVNSKNKRRMCSSVLLLEVVGDGSRMLGASSWYDIGQSLILCHQSTFRRV